ncbi:PQQ-binding-like beta-propeller repeat protein, partial [Escherichia coli]|nr:PQQ-binding-like beta-propeller repeat protein [Escherichia coli]
QFTTKSEWNTSIADGVGHYFSKLSPVYANDMLFVESRDGLVKELDPENGKQLWQTELEEDVIARLSGGITAAYEHLYIGSEN